MQNLKFQKLVLHKETVSLLTNQETANLKGGLGDLAPTPTWHAEECTSA